MKTRYLLLSATLATATAEPAFNGKNLDGWFLLPENPAVWRVVKDKDGVPALARNVEGNYLWTKESYGDFVLELEYKVSAGCNSGVFFRSDPRNPVQGGFEIQILDSHGKEPHVHHTGALYDAKAPASMPEKPAGEWNTFKLEATGPHVIVHINGIKVQDLNLDDWDHARKNPDGSENKFEKPLKEMPRSGHIGFQDHGHDVWYRKIQITRKDS